MQRLLCLALLVAVATVSVRAAAPSTFAITWVGSPPAAIVSALEAAATIIDANYVITQPVRVRMTYQDLGICAPNYPPVYIGGWLYGPGAGAKYNSNIMLSLANQLERTYVPTLTGADVYGTVNANVACNFYTGTDGNPGPTQFDLLTMMLQQFHHGLGWFTVWSGALPEGPVIINANNPPSYSSWFDVNLVNALNEPVYPLATDNKKPKDLWIATVAPKRIYFQTGDSSIGQSGKLRLYAPKQFFHGASLQYFDPAGVRGTVDALMAPRILPGTAIHTIGPKVRAVMKKLGWVLK